MNYSINRGVKLRGLSWLLLIGFVVLLLFWPNILAQLNLAEKAFILTFLVFLIIYSRVFGGSFFVLNLLSMINNGADIIKPIKKNVSKEEFLKFLEEANLLFFVEGLVIELNKVFSFYYDLSLVFLLVLTLVYIGLPFPTAAIVVIGAAWAILALMVMGLIINSYVNAKFAYVFVEELQEFEEITKDLKLEEIEEADEKKNK